MPRPCGGIAPSLAALLLCLAAVAAGADEPGPATTSDLSSLAPRSLLLDGTRAGARMVVVGERGHVLISDDRGAHWRQVVTPTRATLTAVHFPTEEYGFAVGHDAVVLATRNGGESWTLVYADPELESPLLDVWFSDRLHGFAVGAYGLFIETDDGGTTWRSRAITDEDVHHNVIVATQSGRIFVAGERGNLLRSDDGGAHWRALSTPHPASLFGAIALPDDGLLVFGLQGRAYRSFDGGESWDILATGTQASLMGGTIGHGGELVLGGATGVVLVAGPRDDRLEARQRPDRKAVATAAALPGGGFLLIGAFGVEDGGSLVRISEGAAARGVEQ